VYWGMTNLSLWETKKQKGAKDLNLCRGAIKLLKKGQNAIGIGESAMGYRNGVRLRSNPKSLAKGKSNKTRLKAQKVKIREKGKGGRSPREWW